MNQESWKPLVSYTERSGWETEESRREPGGMTPVQQLWEASTAGLD